MSSARCIAAFRTNSDVCSWTRLAARWMRSKVACSARSSMRFVLTATATPPSSFSHLCSQLPITSSYGECTYTASEGCGQHVGAAVDPGRELPRAQCDLESITCLVGLAHLVTCWLLPTT